MERIREKTEYEDYIVDLLTIVVPQKKLLYLAINPCDIYDVNIVYDVSRSNKMVANGYDVWNISASEPIDVVAEEISSQYFNVR